MIHLQDRGAAAWGLFVTLSLAPMLPAEEPETNQAARFAVYSEERDAAREAYEDLLMGRRSGANGSAVLDTVAGLAALAATATDLNALPRSLDAPLEAETLVVARKIVESEPMRMMLDVLRKYGHVDYAHRAADPVESQAQRIRALLATRLVRAAAAVQAADNNFGAAYDTLTQSLPVAGWLIREHPSILSGMLARAVVDGTVRHIEELALQSPPTREQNRQLKAELERALEALDIVAVLRGEAALAAVLITEDFDSWNAYAELKSSASDYGSVLEEAAGLEPWLRDEWDWDDRVVAAIGMPMPEVTSGIDGLFETRLRLNVALEMLDYYAAGTPPEFPLDPFTGDPLRWAERRETCVVYSLGRNREDDGGVDRGVERVDYDVTWRLPCDLIPAELGDASDRVAS